MDLQETYNELDLIIRTLDKLIDDLTNKDYISQLEEIKFEAQDELDKLEPALQAEQDREYNMQMNEYINSVI